MKSAYELAMERLEKNAPTVKLTEAQKAEMAEIDRIALARTAEKELFLGEEIAKTQAAGNWAEVPAIEKQLANERRRIQEEADMKKERVRQGSAH